MQKIAAQVGDKKLIKLRLYRQRTIERRLQRLATVEPWLSVSQVDFKV